MDTGLKIGGRNIKCGDVDMVQSVEKERKNEKNGSKNQSDVILNLDTKFFENTNSRLLTTKETAEYLRVSPKLLRKWVYQGKIKSYKLCGKSLRFRFIEIDRLLQGGSKWE
jgi:excisionase family DNA binding protein